MGDLGDLRIALWQREVREDSPRRSREELAKMVAHAGRLGADCLITTVFPADESPSVIPCGTARIDYGAQGLTLHTENGDFEIGLGCAPSSCDLRIHFADASWSLERGARAALAEGVPSVIVGCVGIRNAGHSVRCFDGASAVFDAQGVLLASLRDDFEPDFAIVSLGAPGPRAEPCAHKLLTALTSTIRRFDQQVLGGTLEWVIGLSGGLDSSVVASLLTHALGAQRVKGFGLSTRYNTGATKGNAANLAEQLGIAYRTASIEETLGATEAVLVQMGYSCDVLSGMVAENVQARMRGHLLCTLAAIEGGVVANNANFVEAALGYSTLYGDSVGALAPIADLTKVDLFDLARDINAINGRTVIPENLLPVLDREGYTWETMPSAELASGQRDPMKWFYHDWLVRRLAYDRANGAMDVLVAFAEDGLEACGMGTWLRFYGLEEPKAFIEDLEWVLRQINGAAYKRIQSVPAIIVAKEKSAFGNEEVQRPWEPDGRYLELRSRLIG